jgi:hypothetical protein
VRRKMTVTVGTDGCRGKRHDSRFRVDQASRFIKRDVAISAYSQKPSVNAYKIRRERCGMQPPVAKIFVSKA